MANKIETVIQHALKTFTKFTKKVPEFTPTEVSDLRVLTDGLTSTDIHKLKTLLRNKGLKEFLGLKKTSLDYLPVYEDECISVGVFVLSEGAKLPIHDHPNMYGIIKVLEGIVKVTSYSFLEFDNSAPFENQNLFHPKPLLVRKYPEILLENKDSSCLLTPTEKNIHEVECVKGPAAFLDILSPPYEDGSASEPRSCHYFEEVGAKDDNDCIKLVQIERPL